VGLSYLMSILACFGLTTCLSFCLNRRWTYRKFQGSTSVDLARYLATTLVQMSLSLGLASLCVGVFGWPYQLAIVLLSIVLVPVNYLLHRRWSFRLGWGIHALAREQASGAGTDQGTAGAT
jgi:putative flippase GtrA